MEKRKLGNSGFETFPLAFGGNVFGWTVGEPMSFRLLNEFVESGFTFIDTADVYSKWAPGNKGGESETIIGNWFKETGKRTRVTLATKAGIEMGPGKKGLSRNYLFRAVEDSLRRLRTDYIDLYQAHVDDPETPLEETLGAYAEMIRQGKIRAIGASNYKGERLAQALQVSKQKGIPRYESLQPQYNLYDRDEYETSMEPVCSENGLGVISYYSLASGFLTGKYRSENDLAGKARSERLKKYVNDRGFRILGALDEVARQYGSTPATVSLAWLISRPGITAPIASATTVEQLKHLMKAPELVLEPSALEVLNGASAY